MEDKKEINKTPRLTPNLHLLVSGIILFTSFFLFIFIWQSTITYFLPDKWNKNLVMMIAFLIIVPIPIYIYDRIVPARCPKCEGEMFGSSFRPAYKECKRCNYYHGYSIFGND